MKPNKALEGGGEEEEEDAMSFQFGGNSSTASSSSSDNDDDHNNDESNDDSNDDNEDDIEAASNPKQRTSKKDKSTKTSDMEQPSSQILHNKKCHARQQHQLPRHERRRGRVLSRVCALVLLAVAVIVIALPTLTMKKTKGETLPTATHTTTNNNTNDSHSDSDNALSNDSSSSLDDTTTTAKDGTQAKIPTTASPPSDDENDKNDNDDMPLCMEVSYQLEHLQWTAEQVWNQQGTTLRTGLEMAALQLAQDFCATYTTPQRQRRKQRNLLAINATAYPATVTNIVELSTHFCPHPYCMVVSQRVCVLYQGQDVDGNLAAVQDGFRQALRHAITTGLLIDMVPPEHLP